MKSGRQAFRVEKKSSKNMVVDLLGLERSHAVGGNKDIAFCTLRTLAASYVVGPGTFNYALV